MITKIIAVAVVTIIISSITKQYRADLSLLINICGGLLIVMLSINGLTEIIDAMVNLPQNTSISNAVIKPLIKVVGIGYITEFCADMAEDSGNKTICSKIIFGGKIAICAVALPLITNMLNAILSLL